MKASSVILALVLSCIVSSTTAYEISRSDFKRPSNSTHSPLPAETGLGARECGIPEPSADARISYVFTVRGQRVSSTSLHRTATTVIDIEIAEEGAPAYVILSSMTPVVWKFTGDVARIEQVVIQSTGFNAVSGIQAERVEFSPHFDCRMPEPASIVSATSMDKLQLHSGKADQTIVRDDLVQMPASGLVVSEGLVVEDLLPGRHGILDLVSKGKLEVIDDRTFRIVAPIDILPPGQVTGNDAVYLLAPGVTPPEDSYGSLCVLDEVTGERLSGNCT